MPKNVEYKDIVSLSVEMNAQNGYDIEVIYETWKGTALSEYTEFTPTLANFTENFTIDAHKIRETLNDIMEKVDK